jgi:tetratricopeptide (TPR) repeat protein
LAPFLIFMQALSRFPRVVILLASLSFIAEGQAAQKPTPAVKPAPAAKPSQPQPAISVSSAIQLAREGKCSEAMPVLKASVGKVQDPDLKRQLGHAGVRCAMSYNQAGDAARFIEYLQHEFPHDPEILFLAVHLYSDLSIRASQELLYTNPSSPQVHQLSAEALEAQGNWKGAISEYRTVLERDAEMPGIHFRIGRVILSEPETPDTMIEAQKEFEAELKINPSNAAAEYILGEMARKNEQWPEAIAHFRKATELDNSLADAYVGLGRALLSAGQPADAVTPLQHATQLQPDNPTTHYYASIALARAGRKPDSVRESELYKQTSAKAAKTKEEVNIGVLGPQRIEALKDSN